MSIRTLDQFYAVQMDSGLLRTAGGVPTSQIGKAERYPEPPHERANRLGGKAVQVTVTVVELTNDAIYRLYVDCGRMGAINAEFRADRTFMERMLTDEPVVYAYEVLGKHSEIDIKLNHGTVTLVTEDPTRVGSHPGFRGNFDPIDLLHNGEYRIGDLWAEDDDDVWARYAVWCEGTPYAD